MAETLDCIVAGSCVLDLLCRPADLGQPIGAGVLHRVDPLQVAAGGITSNAGVTLARLGLSVDVLSYVGDDAWGPVIRGIYEAEHVGHDLLTTHPTDATSTTVVMIDGESGERSFYHCVGAPKLLRAQDILDRLDAISRAGVFLLGYYSLMPQLEAELEAVFSAIRQAGVKTAMDAAGEGGTMDPLERLLPHLDVYVPSLSEARHQTGEDDPERIISRYRACGAPGVLGVKLGKQGALLSDRPDHFVQAPATTPPGPVVDTTGAGDSFYAGLLAGLIRGLPLEDAGKLGCAAGACCCTAMGGSSGGRTWRETAALAGLST